MASGGEWQPARIVESGPVRIVVSQLSQDGAREVRYLLFAGDSPYLVHTVKSVAAEPVGLGRASSWSPAGHLINAFVSYESADGVKHINMVAPTSGVVHPTEIGDVRPFMKEGWYAIEDRAGEVVGVCFDSEPVTALRIDRAHWSGIRVRLGGESEEDRFNSVVVLDRGNWQRVRERYLAFKNPPAVARGQWQEYQPITVPKPNPQKDLHRIVYMGTTWFQPQMLEYLDSKRAAGRIFEHLLAWGGNVLRHRESSNIPLDYWQELVTLAERDGVAIFSTPPMEDPIPRAQREAMGRTPCPVAFRRDYYVRWWSEAARAAASIGGMDLVQIMDEYAYTCACDQGKGAVLYTDAFLSERLPQDSELAAEFRRLPLEQATPAPVTIESEGTQDLDCMLFTDGTRYMLNLLNESAFARHQAKATEDVAVTAIEGLSAETLASLDVVAVPNILKANPPGEWERSMREFVLAGGGALLIHHAVGYGSDSGVMFPEIGRGVDYTPEVEMRVVANHPVTTGVSLPNGVAGLKSGTEFISGSPDYITMAPGPSGQVLVASPRGRTGQPEAVVLAGEVGKGKVVLCGMNIGCQAERGEGGYRFRAEVQPPREYELLLNSIRWLAQ